MRSLALTSILGLLLAGLAACRAGDLETRQAAEIAALRAEVERLRRENEDLRLSPHGLAAEVELAIRAGDGEKAAAAYQRLKDTFPVAPETAAAKRRMDAFDAQQRAEVERSRRLAAQGFRALAVQSTFERDDMRLVLASTATVRRWTFDHWGEGWRYVDAEKDKRILVARIDISSTSKEPALFGIAAYAPDGATLRRLGTMRYRFVRWSSYGAFLGTQADYRNAFSHRSRIPFTAGVEIPQDAAARRPIYLVATRERCHQRNEDRYGQPPILYIPQPCESLKETLAVDDFKGDALAILGRLD